MKELKKPNTIEETFDIVNTNCEVDACGVDACGVDAHTSSEEIIF